jgi:hypothetical protein
LETGAAGVYAAAEGAARLSRRALLAALLLVAAGCAPAATAVPPTRTARGVLLSVESPSIQRVESFTLRTDDGQELSFATAPDFNASASHAMTPGHMRQHMALADPVTVTYREEQGRLVAQSATD